MTYSNIAPCSNAERKKCNGSGLFRHHFRFFLLILTTACLTSVFASMIAWSTTINCMAPSKNSVCLHELWCLSSEFTCISFRPASVVRCMLLRTLKGSRWNGPSVSPAWSRLSHSVGYACPMALGFHSSSQALRPLWPLPLFHQLLISASRGSS